MVNALSVNKDKLSDFELIAKIEDEKYNQLYKALNDQSLNFSEPRALKLLFEKFLSYEESEALLSQTIGLATFSRDSGYNIKETISALEMGVDRHQKWLEENSNLWKKCLERIKNIIEHNSLIVATKSIDLYNSYENILRSFSLITDIRPIFDDEREEMIASSVSTSLLIEYTKNFKLKKECFTLDYQDLQKLEKEVAKALKKAKVVKDQMKSILGNNVTVLGDD